MIVKNTTRGTTTDMDGKFRLEGLQPGDVLQVTYVGYDPYEVTYTGQTTLDILMTTTANQLNAVVVTAMGIERQSKTLSYAAETVGGDDVADIKSVNMINALQGKAAGLQITPNSTGAGGSSKILFRGNKSINGSNQPLVVVDGVPCLKHGHIRRFLIPWTAGSAHRDDFAIRQIRRQFLNQPRQLTDMREHRLRLPQPALSLWNRQQLAAARNHIALRGYGSSGRGVAACVKPDNDALHGFSACFLRRIVPSTPLTKRPLVGSEKRLARLTASLMATGPGIPSS